MGLTFINEMVPQELEFSLSAEEEKIFLPIVEQYEAKFGIRSFDIYGKSRIMPHQVAYLKQLMREAHKSSGKTADFLLNIIHCLDERHQYMFIGD